MKCFHGTYQVGVELAPRDYDMESLNPFKKSDIVSMVPVYKVISKACMIALVWRKHEGNWALAQHGVVNAMSML